MTATAGKKVSAEKPKEGKFKFKVAHGSHAQREPKLNAEGCPCCQTDEHGNPVLNGNGDEQLLTEVKTYEQGDVITSDDDLVALHGAKFLKLGDDGKVKDIDKTDAELAALKRAELQEKEDKAKPSKVEPAKPGAV